jgi:hypothetical protein
MRVRDAPFLCLSGANLEAGAPEVGFPLIPEGLGLNVVRRLVTMESMLAQRLREAQKPSDRGLDSRGALSSCRQDMSGLFRIRPPCDVSG